MRYAGTRRSDFNPFRSLPLARPASAVLRASRTDQLVGDLRNALWAMSGYKQAYAKACATLGRASRHNPAWRRASQRDAMRAVNTARAAMRANARKVAELEAKLLALAVPADLWAEAAASTRD